MIEGIPSQTAFGVAFARALASLPESGLTEGHDAWAERLLPRPYAAFLRTAETVTTMLPAANIALAIATLGLSMHAGFRTACIDNAVREALARGVKQVVLLGAGLDARAYRLPEIAEAAVFEVDCRSTQAWKQKRIGDAAPIAKSLRYVTVDFAKDSLDDKLAEHGHDASAPTIWIWEGVIMYLPRAAREATLAVVAKRSAKGSRMIATYAEPTLSSLPVATRGTVIRLFGLVGEPLLGLLDSEMIARELDASGFTVVLDEGGREWARKYSRKKAPPIHVHERVVVADRR